MNHDCLHRDFLPKTLTQQQALHISLPTKYHITLTVLCGFFELVNLFFENSFLTLMCHLLTHLLPGIVILD